MPSVILYARHTDKAGDVAPIEDPEDADCNHNVFNGTHEEILDRARSLLKKSKKFGGKTGEYLSKCAQNITSEVLSEYCPPIKFDSHCRNCGVGKLIGGGPDGDLECDFCGAFWDTENKYSVI